MKSNKEKTLTRSLLKGCILFILLLFIGIIGVNFLVQRYTIYKRYQYEMNEVLNYVRSYIDVDDLYDCHINNKRSKKFFELQTFFDNFVENYHIHYIYVLKPYEVEEGLTIQGIITGNTQEEYAHPEGNVLPLNWISPYGEFYTEDTVRTFQKILAGNSIVYFNEYTGWGTDYTAAMPLITSDGKHFALLCVDESVSDITTALIYSIVLNIGVVFSVSLFFSLVLMKWLNFSFIMPINSIIDILGSDGNNIEKILATVKTDKVELKELRDSLIFYIKENHRIATNLNMAYDKMEILSRDMHTDVLTGFGNSRLFDEIQDEINLNLSEGNRGFAVLSIDINNLKYVNDTYGHIKGDEYIKGCCDIIRRCCEGSEICRTGGDEFVAIFRGSMYEENAVRANKELLSEFKKAYNSGIEGWTKYTASSGVAVCENSDKSFKAVLNKADAEMYDTKLKIKSIIGSYR